MHIQELQIRRFRNLTALDWKPSPGINLIVGENGQGKTNLLEAIYFGLLGRSFRTRREEQCLPWNGNKPADEFEGTILKLWLLRTESVRRIRLALGKGYKRAWVDDVLAPRLGDLWEGSGVVVFSPSDVDLFRNAPASRRAFLDQLLSLGSRTYLGHLQRYQRALKQVNAALKPRSAGGFKLDRADPFYAVLSEAGGELMVLREKILFDLEALCRDTYRTLEGSGELRLMYDANLKPESDRWDAADKAALTLRERLVARHEDSLRLGLLDTGPHRDDLRAVLDGQDLGKYGSQGQHRLVSLSLKLAAAEWLARGLNSSPVLLLDDFGSELDLRRRQAVISHLGGRMQTFITSTSADALGDAAAFDEIRELRGGNWA